MPDELGNIKACLDRYASSQTMDEADVQRMLVNVHIKSEERVRRVPFVGLVGVALLVGGVLTSASYLSRPEGEAAFDAFLRSAVRTPAVQETPRVVARPVQTPALPIPEPVRAPVNMGFDPGPVPGAAVGLAAANVESVARVSPPSIYPITLDSKTGFIDAQGKLLVAPELTYVAPFTDGIAIVARGEGDGARYAVLTEHGVISPFAYRMIGRFSDGLAPAQHQDTLRWGYIDASGEWFIAPIYVWSLEFVSGYAQVWTSDESFLITPSGARYEGDAPFATPESTSMPADIKPALRIVEKMVGSRILYGVENFKGETVVPAVCRSAHLFSGGIIYSTDAANSRFGLFNADGSIRIMHQFGFLSVVDGDTASLIASPAGSALCGVIDLDAQWLIEPKFLQVMFFDGVLARVRGVEAGRERSGYINTKGDWVYVESEK